MSCTSWRELSEHTREGVALIQLEDCTNVSLEGKTKTDPASPFRSDLSPVSLNGFHIDTGLQPSLIIPLSSTNENEAGLIGGFVHILCLHLISLHPSAASLWWPSPSCKCNQSNSIGHAKWCKWKQLKRLISAQRWNMLQMLELQKFSIFPLSHINSYSKVYTNICSCTHCEQTAKRLFRNFAVIIK